MLFIEYPFTPIFNRNRRPLLTFRDGWILGREKGHEIIMGCWDIRMNCDRGRSCLAVWRLGSVKGEKVPLPAAAMEC